MSEQMLPENPSAKEIADFVETLTPEQKRYAASFFNGIKFANQFEETRRPPEADKAG